MKSKIFIGVAIILASCLENNIVSQSEQLRKDVAKIDKYLADNNITNVIKDAGGVRIVINSLGTGLTPNFGNKLKIPYEGRLLSNGSTFDEGTWVYPLGSAIYGWQECLTKIPAGSEATLYIPSTYAYGPQGKDGIPKNANLVFDVYLEEVELTTAQANKLVSDGQIIDAYTATKGYTTVTDPTGIRYQIISEGDGETPGLYDQITVDFVVKLMPDDVELNRGTVSPRSDFSSRLCNFFNGWQIGIPKIKKGGKMRLFIPSTLALGSTAVGNIPANANLFYELELLDVE